MARNIVYFDLETQKSAAEVGGWGKIRNMLMSIGVTYSTGTGRYNIYTEREVDALIKELFRADLVIGFNHQRFDFTVLEHYTMLDFKMIPTLDLMLDIEQKCGHRVGLDAIAEASCGINKTAEGLQALQWWKEGKIMEIAEYCCYDVKVTKLVHEYGARNGKVLFKSNQTKLNKEVPVAWTLE
ncbi:MAG: ribonuclease H-like domain-containing protein [Verrucomicrobiales bacterium]|jgi:DEAD/DEAH box helicase domain-containing protein|nr:ribonuclease H-like domain-containing protein [Verrucomicrobiales bacterium]MDR1304741.1 ribonuclease H-like domain-containing protein [Verrucomicrobiales bacterium]